MQVFEILIELNEIEQPIWRRILVPSTIWLDDFHRILQTTMGWTNSHIHLFAVGSEFYAPFEFEVEDALDSRQSRLEDILNQVGSQILYEYDFGDGWVHTLTLEQIVQFDGETFVAQCIGGARNCPPEDCGGVFGYQRMCEILQDRNHEEYQSYREWLGRIYNPERFDVHKINKQLQKKDFGCEWIM